MTDWSTLKKLIWLRIIKGGGSALRTVTGAIVHVTNALAMPAKALSVNVEPIQDLHGYDHPWPAGGGVSKCPSFANGTHTMTNGLTVTIQDGEITINGTASGSGYYEEAIESTVMPADAYVSFNNPVGTFNIAYVFINGNTQIASPSTAPENATKQPTGLSGATVNKLRIYCNAATYDNFKMSPIVHDGSTPQAWQPYSNICPISGRTSATVTRTGRNMLNSSIVHGIWTAAGWYDHENYNTKYLSTRYAVPVVGGKTYCFSLKNDSSNPATSGSFIAFANGNAIGETATWFSVENGIINVPSGADSIAINILLTNNFARISDVSATDFQLELGSTASAYEPYQGNTYTIQLGETVYGGTFDFISGKLTVDRAIYDLGTGVVAPVNGSEDARSQGLFSAYGFTPPVARVTDISAVTAPDGIICNQFVAAPNNAFLAPGRSPAEPSFSQYATSFYVQWNGLAGKTNADAKAILTGTQIAAPLATPFEIALTPTQIDMLLGENNLWADAGDSTLTYYAEGEASTSEALGILLGGTYNNPGGADDASDDEALGILLGGS